MKVVKCRGLDKSTDQMNSFATEIEEILAKHDPGKLISAGAPKNEYRLEAKEIALKYPLGGSWEDVARLIGDVFHRNFDFAYALADRPDGPYWTKHVLGMVALPPDSTLKMKSEEEIDLQRLAPIERAAEEIHLLLQRRHKYEGLPVTVQVKYRNQKQEEKSNVYINFAGIDCGDSLRRETIEIVDSSGIERGNINLDLDTNGRLVGIEVVDAQSVLAKPFLNQIWTALSRQLVRDPTMDVQTQVDHAITFILTSAAHSNWEVNVEAGDNIMVINGHSISNAYAETYKQAVERMLVELNYIFEIDICRYQVTESGKQSQRERHGR